MFSRSISANSMDASEILRGGVRRPIDCTIESGQLTQDSHPGQMAFYHTRLIKVGGSRGEGTLKMYAAVPEYLYDSKGVRQCE